MATRESLLGDALAVLRDGGALTLEAVAKRAGLTKPGVVHHFATKEGLAVAVVDHVLDLWEAELVARTGAEADWRQRLGAYVDYALLGPIDPSDLALLADVHLRDRLIEQWTHRLEPWFGTAINSDHSQWAECQAARLLADGAWIDRALGIVAMTEPERRAVRDVARRLIGA